MKRFELLCDRDERVRAVRQMDGREITQHILFLTSCVVFVRGFVLYLCRWMENNSTYFVSWNVAAFKALELNQLFIVCYDRLGFPHCQ